MTGLQIDTIPLGPIGTNCYLVTRDGHSAVLIDPGAQPERLQEIVKDRCLNIEGILITHSHWDHVGALAASAKAFSAPVWIHSIEAQVIENLDQFAPAQFGPWESCSPDNTLNGGEILELAGVAFEAIHLPGHSPGTIGYLVGGTIGSGSWIEAEVDAAGHSEPPVLFVGDLIFRGSVGRTDLPFADTATLLESAKLLLDTLPDDTVLLSGHGEATTIGHERDHNPFLQPGALT